MNEQEVDTFLAMSRLRVRPGRYQWQQKANTAYAELRLPVASPEGTNVRIVVTVNRLVPNKRSFALLVNNVRIRALDIAGSHGNRHTNREEWRDSIHKHRWTDACKDRFAYTPTDIVAAELPDQLSEFCQESSISVEDLVVPRLEVQGRLGDVDV